MGRESIHNLRLALRVMDTFFESLYLGNESRYRDEAKSDFNGFVVSSFFCVNFDEKKKKIDNLFKAKVSFVIQEK